MMNTEKEQLLTNVIRAEYKEDVVALRELTKMVDEQFGDDPANAAIAAQLLISHHLGHIKLVLRALKDSLDKGFASDLGEKMWNM